MTRFVGVRCVPGAGDERAHPLPTCSVHTHLPFGDGESKHT